MTGFKCKVRGQGGVTTYLVLLILQRVLLLFSLHHHLFDLPLKPAVGQLQVGALPETHDAMRHPTQLRTILTHLSVSSAMSSEETLFLISTLRQLTFRIQINLTFYPSFYETKSNIKQHLNLF